MLQDGNGMLCSPVRSPSLGSAYVRTRTGGLLALPPRKLEFENKKGISYLSEEENYLNFTPRLIFPLGYCEVDFQLSTGAQPVFDNIVFPVHLTMVSGGLLVVLLLVGCAVAASVVERNVKSYGAVGNGITDDTQSIITALTQGRGDNPNAPYPTTTYSASTQHPALVFFPPGTYLVTQTLPVIYYTQMVRCPFLFLPTPSPLPLLSRSPSLFCFLALPHSFNSLFILQENLSNLGSPVDLITY
jgi:Pectate lyase superfamily protein